MDSLVENCKIYLGKRRTTLITEAREKNAIGLLYIQYCKIKWYCCIFPAQAKDFINLLYLKVG